MGFLS